eukprot:10909982-Ditylum_brightwellii.AAC.1
MSGLLHKPIGNLTYSKFPMAVLSYTGQMSPGSSQCGNNPCLNQAMLHIGILPFPVVNLGFLEVDT